MELHLLWSLDSLLSFGGSTNTRSAILILVVDVSEKKERFEFHHHFVLVMWCKLSCSHYFQQLVRDEG